MVERRLVLILYRNESLQASLSLWLGERGQDVWWLAAGVRMGLNAGTSQGSAQMGNILRGVMLADGCKVALNHTHPCPPTSLVYGDASWCRPKL